MDRKPVEQISNLFNCATSLETQCHLGETVPYDCVRMSKRDYYEVLGVAKKAGDDEIKSAYRRLARQFHPDVNKAPDAQKKFTEIQHAYDVLSDADKRKMYDVYGHDAESMGGGAGGGGPRGGGAARTWPGGSGAGPGGMGGVKVNLEDLGSIFDTFFGESNSPFGTSAGGGGSGKTAGGGSRGRSGRVHTHSGGAGGDGGPPETHHEVAIDFMTAVKGGVQPIRIAGEGGEVKSIDVTIPKGVADGGKLRVRGQAVGLETDLILTIKVRPHHLFRRGSGASGGGGGGGAESVQDLFVDLPLTIAEATLGASAITVPTIDGRVEVSVPAGSASGTRLRLKGRGIEDSSGTRGDLYAVVKIVPPGEGLLTPAERELLQALSAKQPSVRRGEGW